MNIVSVVIVPVVKAIVWVTGAYTVTATRPLLALICLATISVAQAAQAGAENSQSNTHLADSVNRALLERYTSSGQFADVTINTRPLDPRIKLAPCAEALALKLPTSYRHGRVTVTASCPTQGRQWSINVINEVSLKQRVVIASGPLQKGQIISSDDLSYDVIEINTFNPGHITDHQSIVGQQAKRRINQGDALLAQWLTEPKAIRRGDRVTIQASSSQISVATSGTAMADGRLGEQINVRNNRSDRIIRAKVVAEGRVSINL